MGKLIEIRRRKNTTNLPDNIYDTAKQEIGPVFAKNGKTASGLTIDELKLYMPQLINIPPDDNSFFMQVERYFMNLTINVPFTGVELEIGIDKNTKMPINVKDYVNYRFAVANPGVAPHGSNPSKIHRFVIIDKSAAKEAKTEELNIRKEAYKEFIKLVSDEKRTDMVLKAFGVDPKGMESEDKELRLEDILNADMSGFLKVAKDKNLQYVSLIQTCLTQEVLRKIGNAIFNGDEKLGDNMDDAIIYLKDKKNSGVLTMLKARLEAFK